MLPTRIGGGARSTMRRDGFLPALWGWVSVSLHSPVSLAACPWLPPHQPLFYSFLSWWLLSHFTSFFLVSYPKPKLTLIFYPSNFETFPFSLILIVSTSCLLPPTHYNVVQITSLLTLMVFEDPFNSILLWTFTFLISLHFCFLSCPCLLFFLFFVFIDLPLPFPSSLLSAPFSHLGKC